MQNNDWYISDVPKATTTSLKYMYGPQYKKTWAVTFDFQQLGILTSVDSDEPMQSPF